jgi:hypothetical protein
MRCACGIQDGRESGISCLKIERVISDENTACIKQLVAGRSPVCAVLVVAALSPVSAEEQG